MRVLTRGERCTPKPGLPVLDGVPEAGITKLAYREVSCRMLTLSLMEKPAIRDLNGTMDTSASFQTRSNAIALLEAKKGTAAFI